MSFKDDYTALECRFKAQVNADNCCLGGPKSVFLPNIPPQAPVDFVLIGAEPSLNGRSVEEFSGWIAGGFKNFAYSM